MAQIGQTTSIRSPVGSDSILHLDIPVEMKDTNIVVATRVRRLPVVSKVDPPEVLGWSPGFFKETLGTWEGEPLVRASQGEMTEWQLFV